MDRVEREFDYLARAQLRPEQLSFAEAVMEAFSVEHGCRTQTQVAKVIGKHKSLITQNFSNPGSLDPVSVENYTSKLFSPGYKQAILDAWMAARFKDVASENGAAIQIRGSITEVTLTRIGILVKKGRLGVAIQAIEDAIQRVKDRVIKERLFDLAAAVYYRLGRIGDAIGIAREIIEQAQARLDAKREAFGHWVAVQVMLALPEISVRVVDAALDRIDALVKKNPLPRSTTKPYNSIDLFLATTARMSARVTFAERGQVRLKPQELQVMLAWVELIDLTKLRREKRVALAILAARLLLLHGRPMSAERWLDRLYIEGGPAEVQELARLRARASAAVDGDDMAPFLRRLSATCFRSGEVGLGLQIQQDLARAAVAELSPGNPVRRQSA